MDNGKAQGTLRGQAGGIKINGITSGGRKPAECPEGQMSQFAPVTPPADKYFRDSFWDYPRLNLERTRGAPVLNGEVKGRRLMRRQRAPGEGHVHAEGQLPCRQ